MNQANVNKLLEHLDRYGRLLLTLEKKADPATGLPHSSALMINIRNAQYYIKSCFEKCPDLKLWRFLTVRLKGVDQVSLPCCSLMCFMLIRFKLLSETNTMVTEICRISSQACAGYSIDFMYKLIKELWKVRRIDLIEDGLFPHVCLTPLFLEWYGFPLKAETRKTISTPARNVIAASEMVGILNKMNYAVLPYIRGPSGKDGCYFIG